MATKQGSFYFFKDKQIETIDFWHLVRLRGKDILSSEAQLKLEWIIYYHTTGETHATDTAAHFGISRKTLHKWIKRFEEKDLQTLEEISRAPEKTRQREISYVQRKRIRAVRKSHMRWGKMKLQKLYQKDYKEYISSWKIQKVIEEENLYFDKTQITKQRKKKKQAQKKQKKRITALVKENKIHHLWHVDTVLLTMPHGGYRYLITAIDDTSKLAYARLYNSHSSKHAADFLRRLHYLTEGEIINLHHDNGSEFQKDFESACKALNLPQWYSRVRTPKDNAVLERFNRTIQEEFVETTTITPDETKLFNHELANWLEEYNNVRPHQALDYLTPLAYIDSYLNTHVLPMSSSRTKH